MIEKRVKFKSVSMVDGKVAESFEMEGKVIDKFTDNRERNGKNVETVYYLIADEKGMVHQVRPFNIVQLL
jgi:hypothetical protein